ncbi:DNA packaging protein [Psychromonas sp. psych-6C06]|uniref:phage terminase large subunit family protein n=1 Tax=Psychromonas sp. psych-6C06 TaxID=2058089 RepID=UPI000C349D6D|nr:terminase gpA endonuclease subunit [Psychromonas sp. psych-6C06]PKF60624.1 DNA packaging protein [Psychromonas sp. psych-6C06]
MKYADPREIRLDIAKSIAAPTRMAVSDAAEKYMRVPKGGQNSIPWDASLAPYVLEPMNCLASRDYDAVAFVGPARTGKTNGLIEGWLTHIMICDPSDMLIVQLTEEKAREFSKKRVDRCLRISPELNKRLSPYRNDNNVHDKIFRDGTYLKIGWPSINVLSSSDYRYVALTDYDRWDSDIDGEGDGFTLASKRTTTFMSSGMTMAESSPGFDVDDPRWRPKTPHEAPPCEGIISLYNQGDRRKLYWQCPHEDCHEYFQPVYETFKYDEDAPDAKSASDTVYMQCPHCQGRIDSHQKRGLNKNGVWLKEGQVIDKKGNVTGHARKSRIASFWMEGPAAAFQTWQQLVYKFLSAEEEYELTGSQAKLKAVTNTDLGKPYIPRSGVDNCTVEELMARAEPLTKRIVPRGVRFLVAAIDVQGGRNARFVVQIIGYGVAGERWVIDRYNIKHSIRFDDDGVVERINPAGFAEDWDLITSDVLEKSYKLDDDSGRRMPVQFTACDHGGEDGVSDNAYKYYRRLKIKGLHRRFYLVKGASSRGKLISESFPDNTKNNARKAKALGDVPLYLLQTDEFKDRLTAALERDQFGPNYIHFPDWLGEWFYEELTAEVRNNGKWTKISNRARNEAIDLFDYGHAIVLLNGYEKMNWQTPKPWALDWDKNPNLFIPDEAGKAPVKVKPTPKATATKQASSGFLSNNNNSGSSWL